MGKEHETSPPSSPKARLDFFISYTKSDEPWAEWIAWQLEDAGYRTRLMAWDFGPGSNFVLEMQKAAVECDRTMIVLSPAYLNSAFAAPEWAAAFASDPTGASRRLLPVRVTECDLPGLLKPIVYIDLVGLDEQTARQKLLAGVQAGRAKPPAKPPFPALARTQSAPAFPGTPPVWTVPYPHNPHVTGREEALAQLRRNLAEKPAAAITQPLAVHGLGGVGKTQLAVEYAWHHRGEYDAVLWMTADSLEAAQANLAAQAAPLNLPEADAKEQPVRLEAVLRWLHQNAHWLLVFDSVDSDEAATAVLRLIPSNPAGQILITSRLSDWPPAVSDVAVDVLPDEVGADFLCARTVGHGFDPGDHVDAVKVAQALGGLPLALEQAAAYLLRNHVTFADYLIALKQRQRELLAHKVAGATSYDRSVANTWLVTEERLGVTARTILRLAGFLAPEDIPRSLFTDKSAALKEAIEAKTKEEGRSPAGAKVQAADDALAELAGYSLIGLGPKVFSCHRLVQAVQIGRLNPAERKGWAELALRLVDEAAVGDPRDVRDWPTLEPLRPHIETVVAHGDSCAIPEPTARLMNQLGQMLHAKALDGDAEPLMRRALAICEQKQSYSPNVAATLNNLAGLLQATNRFAEAEPLMWRALAIDEQNYGPDHPNVATALNNLAQLLTATNRLTDAEPLMRRALAIDEKSYDPNHPSVAIRLNNLARLLYDTNRLPEAEPLMRRALAIDEKSYGHDHPRVATVLNNLALLLMDTNRLAEAEPLMRRHVIIFRKFRQHTGHAHRHWQTAKENYTALLLALGLSYEEVAKRLHSAVEGEDQPTAQNP